MTDLRLWAEGAASILVRRRFGHPAEKVLRAHIDPDLARIWLSSDRYPIVEMQMDGRPGGAFRYGWKGEGGSYINEGRFEEITRNRIVHTEAFTPDWTGGPTRVITDFTPDPAAPGTASILTMQVIYRSAEARDAALASGGMEHGLAQGYAKLDTIL